MGPCDGDHDSGGEGVGERGVRVGTARPLHSGVDRGPPVTTPDAFSGCDGTTDSPANVLGGSQAARARHDARDWLRLAHEDPWRASDWPSLADHNPLVAIAISGALVEVTGVRR